MYKLKTVSENGYGHPLLRDKRMAEGLSHALI